MIINVFVIGIDSFIKYLFKCIPESMNGYCQLLSYHKKVYISSVINLSVQSLSRTD